MFPFRHRGVVIVLHRLRKGAGRGGWDSDWGKISDRLQAEEGREEREKGSEDTPLNFLAIP